MALEAMFEVAVRDAMMGETAGAFAPTVQVYIETSAAGLATLAISSSGGSHQIHLDRESVLQVAGALERCAERLPDSTAEAA